MSRRVPKPPTHRERKHAAIRREILRAAASALARRGAQAATMQEIAREAGYTAPSLYGYFQGKGEIIEALRSDLTARFEACFEVPLPTGLNLGQKLEILLGQFAQLVAENQAEVAVFFAPHGGRHAETRDVLVPGFDLFCRRLARWLRAAAAPEELGGHAPADLAYLLTGVVYGFFLRWLHGDAREALPEMPSLVVQLFLHGIGAPASRQRPLSKRGRP